MGGQGRYPSGPCVPAVSRAFAAFERRDFSAAIDAPEPVAGELERIGGSRAQLDLVEFTLVKAYLSADRLDDTRRMLSGRVEAPQAFPLPGWRQCTDRRSVGDLTWIDLTTSRWVDPPVIRRISRPS